MAGIYIHIPFCRKACRYCNFHFSVSLKSADDVINAICKEAVLQRSYLTETIETVYFGGGTPSLLNEEQLHKIFSSIRLNYDITNSAEITLECNPDDITEASLAVWKKEGVNRLSIGIQSFDNEDLQWMNRAHNADQALRSITLAQQTSFTNLTIDLIYGSPVLSDEQWIKNIETVIDLNIPHISCYALTVEEGTALHHHIQQKKSADVDPEKQSRHFDILLTMLKDAGYLHYEISNFAKPGFESKHNGNYWKSKPYLGLGPSAHSYNGVSRQWNIANNALYVQSLANDIVPFEKEELTEAQRLNENIMIALRTSSGISLKEIESKFSSEISSQLSEKANKFIQRELMKEENDHLILTDKGKFLADGIAADLFA